MSEKLTVEELVKALQRCKGEPQNDCRDCPYDCCDICAQSADALESLAAERDAYRDKLKAALEENTRLAEKLAEQEQADKPLELHFGNGKIGVNTCSPKGSDVLNEILFWNPKMQQEIGDSITITDGTTTDDVEAYARLFFSNAESAQVVVDTLNEIIDSYDGNKPPKAGETNA